MAENTDVLLLSHEFDKSFIYNGKRYSPLSDTLRYYLEKKGVRCASISKPYDSKPFTSNHYHHKTVNRLFLINFLLSKITSTIKRKSYVDVVLDHHVKLWTKILTLGRPNVVIALSPDAATCRACHQLSIAIYDMQYGVISERIRPYSKNHILHQEKSNLPTGYLCWDVDSASVLQPWCNMRGIQVIILGNPWVHRFQKMDLFDELVTESVKRLVTNKIIVNGAKKCILVTLQFNLDKLYPKFFVQGELIPPPVLLTAMNALNDEVHWVIRPHPVSLGIATDFYLLSQLLETNENVTINWPGDAPLPAVLSVVNAHITWDSSSVIDASLLGIPSYVLNPEGFWIQKGSTDDDSTDLPYASQEAAGFVTRSKIYPDVSSLTNWVREINIESDAGPASPLFDEEQLYQIATQLSDIPIRSVL